MATNRTPDTIATVFTVMKFSLSLALLAAFLLASCSEEPPPPTTHQRSARYPATQTAEYPPQQQPFNPNGPVQPSGTPPVETTAASPPPPLRRRQRLHRQRSRREIIRMEFRCLANPIWWRALILLANTSTWKDFLLELK